MFTETFHEVVSKEGVVSIVTWAEGEAHVVNTWNSYLQMPDNETLLIPAWKMRKSEQNILRNSKVLLTLGSKEVKGKLGMGTGYLLEGTARYITSGTVFDDMKSRFPFLTRVLEVKVHALKQTI